jgi:signal transduction histidine kinase
MTAPHSAARVGVAIAGAALGIASVVVARRHPDVSLAGDAPWASAVQLLAGWGLVAAGLAYWARRPASHSGPLLAAAGLAWFLVEANDPEVGSSLIFTAGLALFAACPVLLAHAALAYSHGRLRSRVEVAGVALGYAVGVGVLGLLTAALYDPRAQGCLDCPANLVHLGGSPGADRASGRVGLWLVLGWAIIAVALLAWQIARASEARRRLTAPVLAPAALYLALVAGDAAHGIGRGFQSNDPTDRRLWAAQAVALVAVAVGTRWERLRSVRMRRELARLVVELGAGPPSGGVRDALARALGEPDLVLVYCDGETGWVDGAGTPVAFPQTSAVTQLTANGELLAAIGHRPGALEEPELVEEIARAARPALEHERLQAQVRAQLGELRASRTRIVAAADAERRRLEHDLHDGAQQRIVALALDLRLARRHEPRAAPELDGELATAEEDLRLAVAELREVARGIHPVMLEHSGLAAALLALAEEAPRLVLGELPEDRLAPAAESAAYHLVAEILRRAPGGQVEVRGRLSRGRLLLDVESEAGQPDSLIDLEDRIGALDGRLTVERTGPRAALRAELPCG